MQPIAIQTIFLAPNFVSVFGLPPQAPVGPEDLRNVRAPIAALFVVLQNSFAIPMLGRHVVWKDALLFDR